MAKKPTNESATDAMAPVEIAIGKFKAFVTPKYAEGHALTTPEAAALNQLVRENLRNTFRPVVQKAYDKAKEEGREELNEEELNALNSQFTSREAEYEFAKARGPRAPADPVGREAHKIAKGIIMAALAKQKIDPKTLAEGKLDELIKGLIESKPAIKAEAERRVAEEQSIANLALEL